MDRQNLYGSECTVRNGRLRRSDGAGGCDGFGGVDGGSDGVDGGPDGLGGVDGGFVGVDGGSDGFGGGLMDSMASTASMRVDLTFQVASIEWVTP